MCLGEFKGYILYVAIDSDIQEEMDNLVLTRKVKATCVGVILIHKSRVFLPQKNLICQQMESVWC